MNLGKRFPGVVRPMVQLATTPWYKYPPRNLILKCWQYGAPGGKAQKWFNVEEMSTIVEMVDDSSNHFFYEWTCTADPTQVIRADITFEAVPHSFFPFWRWQWDNTFQLKVSGVNWGSGSNLNTTNGMFTSGGGFGGALQIGPPTPPQPTQWLWADFVMRAAEWADLPDYHPYRHEP